MQDCRQGWVWQEISGVALYSGLQTDTGELLGQSKIIITKIIWWNVVRDITNLRSHSVGCYYKICTSEWLSHCFPFTDRRLVHSFGMIWSRLVWSWYVYIKRTDESSLLTDSLVPLMYMYLGSPTWSKSSQRECTQ